MSDCPAVSPTMPKCIGIAANHGGFALKDHLVGVLRGAGCKTIDFGYGDPQVLNVVRNTDLNPICEELQMNQSNVISLMGMKVIGQHGREIGVITNMFADVETWQLQSLEVKLNRETLDDLKLKRPWFGTQTIHVPVSEISGATDNLVLKSLLEKMEFSGGKPVEGGASAANDTSEGTGTPDDHSKSAH